jgi:hypothetical protein
MARIGTHLIITGFVLAYLGVMGLLLMLSSVHLEPHQLTLMRIGLAAMAGVGALILAVGRLLPVRE